MNDNPKNNILLLENIRQKKPNNSGISFSTYNDSVKAVAIVYKNMIKAINLNKETVIMYN